MCQPRLERLIRSCVLVVLVGTLLTIPLAVPSPAKGQAAVTRADAVVLVNSTSPAYQDFARAIQPYLDHFGVPYTVVDVATSPVPANLPDYALIIIGHNRLDPPLSYLDASEQLLIANAVNSGSGLLNFDSVLADGSLAPYYQFIQTVFGFGYASAASATSVSINSAAPLGNYVVAAQPINAAYTLNTAITPLRVTLTAPATSLATLGGDPFLVATTHGQGRAVQWTSYDWMQPAVWGPVRGFDDLIWRSIVWAARKPFVMQGLPPFVTLRVDDVAGPFGWVDTANQYGWKPWGGLFLNDVQDIPHLKTLVDAGNFTVSVHARTVADFLYYDYYNNANFADATFAQHAADASAWFATHQIAMSRYVLPHYYSLGTNVFAALQNWGVQFVGVVKAPGTPLYAGAPMLNGGPFFQYQTACASADCSAPLYFADYLTVPGHPEFNGQFFNVLTEIRDVTGYEWYPDNNVSATRDKGVAWLKRALDGMALATLMTHEPYILYITNSNWEAIMAGLTAGLAAYQPEFVTIDYAAQYVRAMKTSNIASSVYDPLAQQVSTTLSGATDLPTRFYLFTESGGTIQRTFVNVPTFSNNAVVNYPMSPTAVTLEKLEATSHSGILMLGLLASVIFGASIIALRRRQL